MTIKEIADLCGVDETTIARWIRGERFLNCKMQLRNGIMEKLDRGSPEHPSDYNLEETIAIIGEGGGNKTLASLLAENAANKDAIVKSNRSSDSKSAAPLLEALETITGFAAKVCLGGIPDSLQYRPVNIHRIIAADGGRVYVLPLCERKLQKEVLVYDKDGKLVRNGIASNTRQGNMFKTIEDLTRAHSWDSLGAYEEVPADDIFKWKAALVYKKAGLPVLPVSKGGQKVIDFQEGKHRLTST